MFVKVNKPLVTGGEMDFQAALLNGVLELFYNAARFQIYVRQSASFNSAVGAKFI